MTVHYLTTGAARTVFFCNVMTKRSQTDNQTISYTIRSSTIQQKIPYTQRQTPANGPHIGITAHPSVAKNKAVVWRLISMSYGVIVSLCLLRRAPNLNFFQRILNKIIPIRPHSAHIGITLDRQEYYTQKSMLLIFLRCQGCYNQKKFTSQLSSGPQEICIARYTKLQGRDCAKIWNGI